MMKDEYLKAISFLKNRYEKVWETVDWLGYPIVAFWTCGREDPPIVITAGAIGGTQATVYAAFELILSLNYEKKIVVIPARDPVGFHNLNNILFRMFKKKIDVITRLVDLIEEEGGKILINQENFFLGIVRNIGFAFHKDYSRRYPKHFATLLKETLVKNNLIEELDGTRILFPFSKSMNAEEAKIFTFYVNKGRVMDYDYFSGQDEIIPEVYSLKSFLNQISPSLVIDLQEHEGEHVKIGVNNGEENIIASLKLALSQISEDYVEGSNIESENSVNTENKIYLVEEGSNTLIDHMRNKNITGISLSTPLDMSLEKKIENLMTLCKSLINIFALISLI